jgi:glyoxylase-like metal-dependent hydrolase (beta-lactamase superfamily II)
MRLIPILDQNNGCSSYIIGDEISGKAAVIDPLHTFGYKHYIIEAAKQRLNIVLVIDTHVHADHYSEAKILAKELKTIPSMSELAPNSFNYNKLKDGQIIFLGSLKLDVMNAPGHTPENIAIAVTDNSRSNNPWCVFTGDSLFVGDVGRPDLVYTDDKMINEAIKDQYETLFNKIVKLPEYVEIYPAHSGSSPCGGIFLSPKFNSTIGFEKMFNVFLLSKNLDEFQQRLSRTLKPPPPEANDIRNWNLSDQTKNQMGVKNE